MAGNKRISQRNVCIAAVLLLMLLAWVLAWRFVGRRMEQAMTDTQYTHFIYEDAIYARCTAQLAAESYGLKLNGTAADCGTALGKVQFTVDGVTVHCEAFAPQTEPHPIAEPVLLVQRGDEVFPYELVGFTALSEQPSITEVCAAYGIASAEDILSVTVYDADGAILRQLAEEELPLFYRRLIALGEDMGADGQAQAYYDAYIEKYGEGDALTIENGTIEAADDAAYQQAMELWGTGMCRVTMKLKNGFRLADMVYAPVPEVFQVYGYYAITEPFFE
ncbi:MAG: hypothetical protein E7503_00145 [Ruminococcus sp.]|nr:hypothetical protein [Ruminococcus sp.]